MKAGTLITHDQEYALPDGVAGRVLDLVLLRPLLAVALLLLQRRARHWIETADD